MRKTERFWEVLERFPDHERLLIEWAKLLGQEIDRLRPYLQPTLDLASLYPCPGGGEGCPREVICHAPNRFVAVCRDELQLCDRLELQQTDLVLYRLDLRKILQEIAKALSLRSSVPTSDPGQRIFSLGTAQVPGHHYLPVTLFLPDSQTEFLAHVNERLVSDQTSFILLTPTSYADDQVAMHRLNQRGATYVALEDALQFREGNLVATRALLPLDTTKNLPRVNLFQRQGDYWQVQYAGQTASIRHRAGIETLALLLREEGRSWAPEHIAMEGEGASPEGQTEDLVLDEIAILDIRQQIHALDKRIQKAENSGQKEQARGFRDEQAALHQYLKAGQRHDGRSRSFQDSTQRLRNRIGRRIRRAIGHFQTAHPEMHLHLKTTLHNEHGTWTYRPEQPMNWVQKVEEG